jgi:signal transduction histidine kinase/CheY-like chemotaxis protein
MSTADFALFLERERDRIVASFVAELQRKSLPPPGLSASLLADHIPKFLDDTIAELAGTGRAVRPSQDAIDTSETARQHGEQRWTLGYDLEGLIREYGVLRHCILRAAKEAGVAPSVDEFDVLAKCLSVGVAEAAKEFAKYHGAQLAAQRANLEFLAEAGQLLSSSLDYRSTLTRLTGLLVPRLADFCAVYVGGGNGVDVTAVAHIDRAKEAALRDLYRHYAPPQGTPSGHRHVMQTGEPEFVAEAGDQTLQALARSPEHLALLRALNPRSWIIVPLRVQGGVFGALVLAYSDSGRRYEASDLSLAGELARRASVAIDNAKLYEMSQNARSRVEAATRAKDEFVAMVSHELRTPLVAILGWLRLMQSGVLPGDKREHALAVIERNVRAQNQLVADLLDISRAITGKIRISPSQLDFRNVVDLAIEGVRPAADAKRIRIEADLERDEAVLRGDGERLQQVVWSLLANAVKFTAKNGLVRVRLRRVNSDLELEVEDDGEGIRAEFLPHVFESFRQADTSVSRPHGGLGIGLSIAKHVVELHGGAIEARSDGAGRGATFKVRLPISPLVSTTLGVTKVPATKQSSASTVMPAGLDGVSVLVVDDEPDAAELVAYVFETCGMEVRVAGSAAEALEVLEGYTPDVIVSDVGMPVEDGYAFIRAVRTLAADGKKNIPAIALTAFASNEDRARALVEGFNAHMAKPVEPAVLAKAVAELAGRASR